MDWYFGNGVEDFVVPNNQELADELTSPESWSEWGLIASENFESSNKCFDVNANMPYEELKFNGKSCNDAEFNSSAEVKDPSSCSSISGSLLEEPFNRIPASYPHPDYQLDEFAGIEQIDDIFFSSLEDLPGSDDFHKSFCSSPENQSERMATDYLLTDSSSDSQSVPNNGQNIWRGSTNYPQIHPCSPSVNLDEEIPALHVPWNKNSQMRSGNGFVTGEVSHEESVLQELEIVMTQLSDKTRICFRDAFFRLAKNSEQNHVTLNQRGDLNQQTRFPTLTTSEEKMRGKILMFVSGRKETTESKTNIIDRAIANLTFNKIESSARDFPAATPSKMS